MTNITDKQDSFSTPIAGIYILDPGGIPVFARYYHGEGNETDSTLLGGFFSAIEIFVKTNLDGLLSDIGLSERRFFFERTSNGYIIIIIAFSDDKYLIQLSSLNVVKLLQSTIQYCFRTLINSAENNLMKLDQFIQALGETIDSFILESTFEFVENDNADQKMYDELNSIQITNEQLDEIIKNIKSS